MQMGDRRIGFVVLESVTKGFFTAAHAERLRAIADQAAAISNARLAGQATELAAAEDASGCPGVARRRQPDAGPPRSPPTAPARGRREGTKLHGRLERLRTDERGAGGDAHAAARAAPDELVEITCRSCSSSRSRRWSAARR